MSFSWDTAWAAFLYCFDISYGIDKIAYFCWSFLDEEKVVEYRHILQKCEFFHFFRKCMWEEKQLLKERTKIVILNVLKKMKLEKKN